MTRDDIRKKLIYNQNQIGNIRTTINEQESQIENLEGDCFMILIINIICKTLEFQI